MIIDLSDILINDKSYGLEVSISLKNGNEIRTNSGQIGEPILGADYLRVVSAEGVELAYWISDEWQEEPKVLGSILGCALGLSK